MKCVSAATVNPTSSTSSQNSTSVVIDTLTDTGVTQTPVIKASNTPAPTDMSDTESSSEDGGVPIAVLLV